MGVSHGPDLDPEFVGGIVLGYIANRTVKRGERLQQEEQEAYYWRSSG